MSADIRMADWQTQMRAIHEAYNCIAARYLCGEMTRDEHIAAIADIKKWQKEITAARMSFILRGYWDHRPKNDR